jgi:hypothetical protein
MSPYHKPPAALCPVTAAVLAAEARQRFEQKNAKGTHLFILARLGTQRGRIYLS